MSLLGRYSSVSTFYFGGVCMKKNRKAQVNKKELYWYLDYFFNEEYDDDGYSKYTEDEVIEYYELSVRYECKLHYLYNSGDFAIYDSEEYYGIFRVKGSTCIDPKRFYKIFKLKKDEKYNEMSNRSTHYFHPKHKKESDYTSFYFNSILSEISNDWKFSKNFYKDALKTIKSYDELYPSDDSMLNFGYRGVNGSNAWARDMNSYNKYKYENDVLKLRNSLYSQFWSQICSKIEAICVMIYSKKFPKIKKWERKIMYYNIDKDIDIESLDSFKYHDRLYRVWNFIKHNNVSTYNKLKEFYPESLNENKYQNGDLSIFYLNITDKLIDETINGLLSFFNDWCEKILDEKINEYKWNYEEWFYSRYSEHIELVTNPLGLGIYDEFD